MTDQNTNNPFDSQDQNQNSGQNTQSTQPTQPLTGQPTNSEQTGSPQSQSQSQSQENGSNTSSTSTPQYSEAPGYGANIYGQNSQSTENNGQNGYGSGSYGTYGYGSYGYGSQNGGYGSNSGYGQGSYGSAGYNQPGQNTPGTPGTPGTPNMPGMNMPGMPNRGSGNSQARSSSPSPAGHAWVTAIVSALVAALIVLGIGWAGIANGWITIPQSTSLDSQSSSSGSNGTAKVPSGKSIDWQALNKRVAASVVSIRTQTSQGVALGSGAIFDKAGNVVTNNHVIEGAQQIQVTLSNGNMYGAKLVGTDSTTDLAVIRIENAPSNLTPVTFANSSQLAVGEQVMAIGNPLGYDNTATTGIVSALNRPVAVSDESNNEVITNAVQIDAAINPGNSGGPTFDAAGNVIGINESIATASQSSSSNSQSSSAGSIGIGFAIPSNLVQRVAKSIISTGKVQHAQLGIMISNGSATINGVTRSGAKVVSVNPGGPGSKAGLRAGDVIVGFDNNSVGSMYSLLGYVRAAAVGDTATLTVIRDNKSVNVTIKLDQVESTTTRKNQSGNSGNNGGNGNKRNNGNNNSNNDDNDDSNGGLFDPFGLFGF